MLSTFVGRAAGETSPIGLDKKVRATRELDYQV